VGTVATRGNSYTPMRIFTVKLPLEVYIVLKEKAEKAGLPMSVIVRMAIVEYLKPNSKNVDKTGKMVIKG